MCGRFVQVISIDKLSERFDAAIVNSANQVTSINIAPGDYAYVITKQQKFEIRKMRFGLQPSWSQKPMYLFNARAEGDNNLTNDKNFKGEMGIFQKPAFKKPIRSQRCLVMANAFIEGPEGIGLEEPYAVYLKAKSLLPWPVFGTPG
jgi:putative SOS response-associated peptidase YedK